MLFPMPKKSPVKISENNRDWSIKELFDSSPMPMWIFEVESLQILAVNRAASKLYGYTQDELMQMTITRLRQEENVPHLVTFLKKSAYEPERSGIWTHRKKSGEEMKVEVFSNEVVFAGLKCRMVQIIDRTEAIKAEEIIAKQNSLYSSVINSSKDIIIFSLDTDLKFTTFNENHRDVIFSVFGVNAEIGNNLVDGITDSEIKAKALSAITRAMAGESYYIEEYRPKSNSHYSFNWSPIIDVNKNVIGVTTFIRDITLTKELSKKSETNEVNLKYLIENMPVMLIAKDSNGAIVAWNKECERVTGYTHSEVVGKKKDDSFLYPEANHLKYVSQLLKKNSEHYIHLEWQIVSKNAEVKTISWSNKSGEFPIHGWKSWTIGVDVTQSRKAEQELRKLTMAIEQNPASIVITDTNGNIQYVNPKFCAVSGYSGEEVIGNNLRILKSGETDQAEYKNLWETILSGKEWRGEFHNKKKNGELFWESAIISPITNADGKVINYVAVKEDITEKKAFEKILIENQKKYQAVIEGTADGVYIIEENSHIVIEANKAFLDLLGYSKEEVSKISVYDFIEGGKSAINERIHRIKFANASLNGERRYIRKDGGVIDVDATASPITYGEKKCIVTVVRDITHRKLMEKEILSAKESAEESNRLKSSFLSNMSHELRTPLIGILGYSEILSDVVNDKAKLDMVRGINRSGNRLLETLNLILDFAVLESNKFAVALTKLNVAKVVADAANLYTEQIKAKNLNFVLNVFNDEIYSQLDERMLKSIVGNLLSNAIKFTDAGSIKVDVEVKSIDDIDKVVIRITDTGTGIDPKMLKLIFNEFRQVSEGFARSHEGVGLGLTIAKKFVDKMNGKITVSSEPGKGSAFELSFPVFEDKLSRKLLKIPAMLMIDDDTIAFGVVNKMVEGQFAVDYAPSETAAKTLMSKNEYSIILLDIELGHGNNGFKVLKEIRKNPKHFHLPIIATTAYALPSEERRFIQAGFTGYIAKPFTKSQLMDVLRKAPAKKVFN